MPGLVLVNDPSTRPVQHLVSSWFCARLSLTDGLSTAGLYLQDRPDNSLESSARGTTVATIQLDRSLLRRSAHRRPELAGGQVAVCCASADEDFRWPFRAVLISSGTSRCDDNPIRAAIRVSTTHKSQGFVPSTTEYGIAWTDEVAFRSR